jgi:hypothetical protein
MDQTWTNFTMARDKTSSAISWVHDARMSRSFANDLTAVLAKMIE